MTEIQKIQPVDSVEGVVSVPGSKSITNRALVIAALAEGTSVLRGMGQGDDVERMLECMGRLGFEIECDGDICRVAGRGGKIPAGNAVLDAGNSGTTIRFLTAMASLGEGTYTLDGNERMRERPIGDLIDALRQLGVKFEENQGRCPPVAMTGGTGAGGKVKIKGSSSSQYITALLMIAPYLEKGLTIEIDGEFVSKPYVDITVSVMGKFGVLVRNDGYRRFSVDGGRAYRPMEYGIEGDASAASYFLAAAAICGGAVRVKNVNIGSVQGDAGFADLLGRMGCTVSGDGDGIKVESARGALRGLDVDMNDMPDMVQTLAVVSLFARGRTIIRNVSNLRLKETDRLGALTTEINKLGARAIEREDGIEIEPGELHGARIKTYDDHRMAMSFALAGLRVDGVEIEDPGCVAKTFPGYFEVLESICRR